MSSEKQYFPWVDWAKAIGLFLVTWGHGGLSDEPVCKWIYSFHMPLFFLLSGMLYTQRSFADTLRRDWRRLIVPYLLLNLFCLVPFLLSPLKGTFTFERLFHRLGAIALGLGYEADVYKPVSTPCWYFIALFYMHIIASFLPKNLIHRWQGLLCLSLASFASVWALHVMAIDLYFPLDSAMLAFLFFLIGYRLKEFILRADFSAKMFLTTVVACLAISVMMCTLNGRVDINTCKWGQSAVAFYLGGVVGASLVFLLSKKASQKVSFGGVKLMTTGAPLIIGLNLWSISLAKLLYKVIFYTDAPRGGVRGLCVAIVAYLLFIPLIILFKRYFPAILGVRK